MWQGICCLQSIDRDAPLLSTLRELLGAAYVLTGPEAVAAGFGRDWTGHYDWVPAGLVRPGSVMTH